jgi:hypothetical protein
MAWKTVDFQTVGGRERIRLNTEDVLAVHTGNTPPSVTIIFRGGGSVALMVRSDPEADNVYNEVAGDSK